MAGSVIKNVDEFNDSHRFLAEELMMPMTNKCDGGRGNMFCGHFSQTVILDKPERPRVFTRFENAMGAYTSAVRYVDDDATIISQFQRTPLETVYAIKHDDGPITIHFASPVRHLTETYGYKLKNDLIEKNREGDRLTKDTIIQSWPCHDDYGNFMYGVNLNIALVNHDDQTFEDAIILSRSAANRMTHTSVEMVTVNLNTNDLTLNLLGDEDNFKGFADIGEEIRDGILLVRRRINHESILFDLSKSQIGKINEGDTPVYCEGRVVNIEIFSNMTDEALEKYAYYSQILRYQREWKAFCNWVIETFGPYVTGEVPGGYSEDVGYWYRLCTNALARPWRYEESEYDGIVLRFTVAKENPINVGSKITNRMGGKGVISEIREDADMPVDGNGVRVDALVNNLGIINRLNPGQLFEIELNHIAECVKRQISSMYNPQHWQVAYEHLLKFYSIVSIEQHDWFRKNIRGELAHNVIKEIATGEEPIYIHQAPFFKNCSLDALDEAYKTFNVQIPDFSNSENKVIVAKVYYLKLRHEPKGKFSARSAKHLSIAGVPTKNTRGIRTNTEHHSSTPIRFGEQEFENLFVVNHPDEIKRFHRLYATDERSRKLVIKKQLTGNPFSDDRIDPDPNGTTQTSAGMRALLETIGLDLQGDDNG